MPAHHVSRLHIRFIRSRTLQQKLNNLHLIRCSCKVQYGLGHLQHTTQAKLKIEITCLGKHWTNGAERSAKMICPILLSLVSPSAHILTAIYVGVERDRRT